jgi:hypothetical protein
MLSKVAKFGVSLGWSIIMKALEAKFLVGLSDVTKKVANQLVKVGEKSVKILTNDNPDDKAELNALLESQKVETAIIGLEVAEQYAVENIKDELTQMLVLSSLQEVRKALETGTFSNAAILEKLQNFENLPK